MATTPEQVRKGLQVVTAASVAEVRAVATSTTVPAEQRSLLLEATPLIVSKYVEGTAALALDWYEELRDLASPQQAFTPTIVAPLREEFLGNAVAWATEEIVKVGQDMQAEIDALTEQMLANLEPVVQREVAAGFWDTVTENTADDPDAVGWQRFTRGSESCPFCRMLADKGAVYSADTARFAAHKGCHCVAAPKFGDTFGEPADAMQYLASKKRRSEADKARLREYLKQHYGA